MSRRAVGLAAVAFAAACARIEAPPGGPPDTAPPQLVATTPDSMAVVPGFDGDVEFVFDEVISEGSQPNVGAGTGDLERLIILSPSPNVPEVSWRRNRIGVRPREGWRPDRVYRVELRPGVVDLRQNRYRGEPAVVTFTTGAPAPSVYLRGSVVDWATGRPAPSALVEAVLVRDSLVYRGLADSSGTFRLGPLPSGAYEVYAVLDANRSYRRDSREAWASIAAPPDSVELGTFYAFVHDTIPPRGRTAALVDSTHASITATQPLLPGQAIEAAQVRILTLPDSVPVPVAGARLRAPADTALPAGGRPPLTDQVVVEAGAPFAPGTRYVIIADSIRNVTGVPGELRAVFDVRPAAAADTTGAVPADGMPADTLPADPLRTPEDTLPAAPADTAPPRR